MNPMGVVRQKENVGITRIFYVDPSQTQNPMISFSEVAITSIGEFTKGEIDGKPNFIFNFLAPPVDVPSSSSSSPEPLFICPSLRLKFQQLRNDIAPSESERFDTSPLFPTTDQRVLDMLESDDHGDICKLAVVPFCLEEAEDEVAVAAGIFEYCGACGREILRGAYYYLCYTCCYKFHKECVESPLEIKHPSHPFHSFQLYSIPPTGLDCILCETSLRGRPMIYFSPTSNLAMHLVCAMNPIPIVIDHPKRHPHPLTFFPKQEFLPCNVCGLIKESFPLYVCLPCAFVVHQDCVYFPYVIRMSRHHHRISFTSSLPSRKLICGVCRREIDNHYGAYSCNKCDGYFVHSKCALRKDLWDGVDLEGIPEEPEMDVEPFERIAEGIIKHFSHDHLLKLEIFRAYDQDKFCQACILPIYKGDYYSCIDKCDFIFHEACASFPRKIYHAFHRHQLVLVTSDIIDYYEGELKGCFHCGACERVSGGFAYECSQKECGFQLDVRCASICEPFDYPGHEHPLFLALNPQEENSALCHICHRRNSPLFFFIRKVLTCIECRYFNMCLRCATLPYKARYKHDRHFLTFREGQRGSDQSNWCEVCEKKIFYSKKGGFYSCDDCCTTLHVNCLLGKEPYMKPGHTIDYLDEEYQIVPNNTQSQPFCHVHNEDHCRDRVVYKKDNMVLCSYKCLEEDKEEEGEVDEEYAELVNVSTGEIQLVNVNTGEVQLVNVNAGEVQLVNVNATSSLHSLFVWSSLFGCLCFVIFCYFLYYSFVY